MSRTAAKVDGAMTPASWLSLVWLMPLCFQRMRRNVQWP